MKETAEIQKQVHERLQAAVLHELPSYRQFLIKTLKSSQPYGLYARIRAAFAPTIWLARIFRITRRVFLIIETSAVLLFVAALFLLLLPLALLLALALVQAALRERRRMNRRLAPLIVDRRVAVLFAGERALALTAGYTVVCVTDALPSRHPALGACRAKDGAILVREHYFFYLRRTLLPQAKRVALIF